MAAGNLRCEWRPRPGCAGTRPSLLRALVFTLGLALLSGLGCGSEALDRVPSTLLGRWENDSPTHFDRWFQIRRSSLVWGVGQFEMFEHPIDRVVFEGPAEDGLHYRFYYTETEGYDAELLVRMKPGLPPTLRLGERDILWRRAGA